MYKNYYSEINVSVNVYMLIDDFLLCSIMLIEMEQITNIVQITNYTSQSFRLNSVVLSDISKFSTVIKQQLLSVGSRRPPAAWRPEAVASPRLT